MHTCTFQSRHFNAALTFSASPASPSFYGNNMC